MASPHPEEPTGWIGVALRVFERGGPAVISLLLAVALVMSVKYLLGEINRLHTVVEQFYAERLACEKATVVQLERLAACQADRRARPGE